MSNKTKEGKEEFNFQDARTRALFALVMSFKGRYGKLETLEVYSMFDELALFLELEKLKDAQDLKSKEEARE